MKSVNAWNKSSERRRRGSTRSVYESLRSKSGSSVFVSRRLRSENDAVRRREGSHRRRSQRFGLISCFCLPQDGWDGLCKDNKVYRTVSNLEVSCDSVKRRMVDGDDAQRVGIQSGVVLHQTGVCH